MVSAGVCYGGKGQLHFVEEKAKVNTNVNCQMWFSIAGEFCQTSSYSSKTGLLPKQRHWHTTGLVKIVRNLSERTSGHRIRLI